MDFVFQFGEFAGSNDSSWFDSFVTIITSFGSAFIGAWVALKVYKDSVRDQRIKENNQRESLEISKLKYLGFLMTDVFLTSRLMLNNINQIRKSYSFDKFNLPAFSLYPQNSVLIIAEKLNQEDYYHASINQLKDDGVAEMFFLINNLARQNENLIKTYESLFAGIIQIIETIPSALDDSKDSIGDFIAKVNSNEIQGEFFEDISQKLVTMILNAYENHLKYEGQSNVLNYSSLNSFVKPSITLLTPYAHLPELKSIVYKSQIATAKFKAVEQKTFEMIDFAEFQAEQIEKTLQRLNQVSTPLRIFYNDHKMNTQNS